MLWNYIKSFLSNTWIGCGIAIVAIVSIIALMGIVAIIVIGIIKLVELLRTVWYSLMKAPDYQNALDVAKLIEALPKYNMTEIKKILRGSGQHIKVWDSCCDEFGIQISTWEKVKYKISLSLQSDYASIDKVTVSISAE